MPKIQRSVGPIRINAMTNFHLTPRNDVTHWEESSFAFEHAMAGYILENPQILRLNDSTYSSVSIGGAERSIGASKRVDIIVSYQGNNGSITNAIVELKNVIAKKGALTQIQGYLSVAPQYSLGVLVAPDFDFEVIKAIKNSSFGNIYGIKITRYKNDSELIVITDVIYPLKNKKDYTRYRLTNLQGCKLVNLTKTRLAWEIVYSYIKSKPSIVYKDLQNIFEDRIQNRSSKSTLHLIETEGNVLGNQRGRYSNEPIALDDDTNILVSNQWNPESISIMIEKAKKLKMKISTNN